MTIEEKRKAIKKYCNDRNECKDCICHIDKNCWHIINHGSDKEAEEIYNILTYGKAEVTRNIAEASDSFICDECGLHLEHIKAVYDVYSYCSEYKFNCCPSCGRWVVEE